MQSRRAVCLSILAAAFVIAAAMVLAPLIDITVLLALKTAGDRIAAREQARRAAEMARARAYWRVVPFDTPARTQPRPAPVRYVWPPAGYYRPAFYPLAPPVRPPRLFPEAPLPPPRRIWPPPQYRSHQN